MLDCRLFGLNPAGHHFTNLLFHIANTLLLFLVLARMTAALWPSAFVAALFALHPLHVESVAWVSERKDVLSTFFWLLTMWFYVRYTERPRFAAYLPVMLALALGLMAKQMLVTLPFVLLLLDYWPLGRFPQVPRKSRRRKGASPATSFSHCFVEKIPLLILSAVASLIVLLVQSRVALVKSASLIPIRYRLANALVTYAKYMSKMFWPARLGILYPHPGANLPLWQILLAACVLLCLSVAAVKARRSHRWLIVGWLWYLGTLVPVIGLVQVGHQAMADRYTYVPLIGLFVITAWTAAELLAKQKYRSVILAAGAATTLSALAVLTGLQLRHWQNSVTLFKHTVAVTANNDILHYNLGALFAQAGNIDEAIKHWTEALRIEPAQPTIHKNLAILLTQQGKTDLAIEHYRLALKYKPNDPAAQQGLRMLLAERGLTDPAEVLYNRANVFAQQRRFDEAITCYIEAIKLKPDYAAAHNNLGNALFLQGKHERALSHYSQAIQIDPNSVDAHYNMAVLLAQQGKTDQAIEKYRKALQLNPNHAAARAALQALLKNEE